MKIFHKEFLMVCDRDGTEIFTIDTIQNALRSIIVREHYQQDYKVYFLYQDKLNIVKRLISKKEIATEVRYKIIEQGYRISAEMKETAYKMAGIKMTGLLSEKKRAKNYQTGSSNRANDKQRKAKAPGKRISATGRAYTERRANRSDKRPKYKL